MRLFLWTHDGLHERGALSRPFNMLTVFHESAVSDRNRENFLMVAKAILVSRGMSSPSGDAEQGR